MFAGDLPHARAHFEDGLAVLPAAVCGRARPPADRPGHAAGVAGDEERARLPPGDCRAEPEGTAAANRRRAYSAYSLWALGRGPGAGVTSTGPPACNSRACGCAATTGWAAPGAWRRWPGSPRPGTAERAAAVLLGAAAGLWQSMGTTLDGNQPWRASRDCERQARQALGERRSRPPTAVA